MLVARKRPRLQISKKNKVHCRVQKPKIHPYPKIVAVKGRCPCWELSIFYCSNIGNGTGQKLGLHYKFPSSSKFPYSFFIPVYN